MTSKSLLYLTIAVTATVAAAAIEAKPVREPLPLKTALALKSHNARSSFDLSPDGQWLASTVELGETLESGSRSFSPTGKPFAEGDSRMQAVLSNTKTGEMTVLNDGKGSSWAPVWSPDGQRVAFYSDSDGEAGVWIWERATGKAQRFPGVIARHMFGFEAIRWSPDGQRLLCKILPAGMTVAQANALEPKLEEKKRYADHGPDEPGVFVLSAKAKQPGAEEKKPDAPAATGAVETGAFTIRSQADLAVLDLKTRKVTRIAEKIKPLWYAFSPDQKYIAYSDLQGFFQNSQQAAYGIELYEVATGQQRSLGKHLMMSYGIEMNWSPDSRSLAYMTNGQLAKGEFVVVSVANGSTKTLSGNGIPSFNSDNGERPPLWDAQSKSIYGIGEDQQLWRIDVASGQGRRVGDLGGYGIRTLVTRPESPVLWTTGGGTVWALAREKEGSRSGIFSIDPNSGKTQAAVQEERAYSAMFNVDASDATGEFAYVAKDQQHLPDGWVFSTKTKKSRQVSHLNPDLERYELGSARLIEYKGVDGKTLRSALLLPPGYTPGKKLPTVVWVYGGSNGSASVNSFGFWGDIPTFNMHILATRGYAVLFPDTPLGKGTPMKDLLNTVVPAVDAAIQQGYTDPDRLAITGQSYGSYSSLAVIAQTPRFKAAIITAAVLHPDLFAAYLEMSPDGKASSIGYYEQGQGNMIGDIWEHKQRYFDNSPIFLFDKIQTPLLIGQGDQDGRLLASDAMFVGLQRLGKEVEYRIYQDEGHVITRPANVLDFWNRRLDFLAEHLDVADPRARAR